MPMATVDEKAQRESKRLIEWRKDAWLRLGWNQRWSSFLAGTQMDVYQAMRMQDQGATQDQIVRILAGYGPLGVDANYDWEKFERLLAGKPEPLADDEIFEDYEERLVVAEADGTIGTA